MVRKSERKRHRGTSQTYIQKKGTMRGALIFFTFSALLPLCLLLYTYKMFDCDTCPCVCVCEQPVCVCRTIENVVVVVDTYTHYWRIYVRKRVLHTRTHTRHYTHTSRRYIIKRRFFLFNTGACVACIHTVAAATAATTLQVKLMIAH